MGLLALMLYILIGVDVRAASAVAIPVSYTHLRAHETVLDLVCRLLLENKKFLAEKDDLEVYKLFGVLLAYKRADV